MPKVSKSIATLTMHGLPKMTDKGRKIMAKWLHSRANWVEKHGQLADSRWTAKYIA